MISSNFFLDSKCLATCPISKSTIKNLANKLNFKLSSPAKPLTPLFQVTPNSTITLEDICCPLNCLDCKTFSLDSEFTYTGGAKVTGKVYYNLCLTCNSGSFLEDDLVNQIVIREKTLNGKSKTHFFHKSQITSL